LSGRIVGGSAAAGPVRVIFGALIIGLERIGKELIENVELVTEENKKRISSALGWGTAGTLFLGPIGGIAGLVFGGRTKEICFALYLKDGRKYLITSDPKTFQSIKAMSF
jgi:hypothetical protein